jgi:hypothetical protein
MFIVTIMKIPNLVWFMQRMCVFGVCRGGFVKIIRRSSMQFQFKRFTTATKLCFSAVHLILWDRIHHVTNLLWRTHVYIIYEAIIVVIVVQLRYNYYVMKFGPPLWSSGQSSWLRIRRPGFDSRHYRIFWKKKKEKQVVGLERGPLRLVSTTEELLDKKSSGSCLENREYGRRDPSRCPRGTLYPQKLATTLPRSGGRSVGIVCLRTQTMEFSFFLVFYDKFPTRIPYLVPASFAVTAQSDHSVLLHFTVITVVSSSCKLRRDVLSNILNSLTTSFLGQMFSWWLCFRLFVYYYSLKVRAYLLRPCRDTGKLLHCTVLWKAD